MSITVAGANPIPWWKEPSKDQWLACWIAAWLGWTLDSFDFTVFLLLMVPIRTTLGVPLTEVAVVFTLTLWMRLVGATASGWLADRIGRKKPLMISIAWFSVPAIRSEARPGGWHDRDGRPMSIDPAPEQRRDLLRVEEGHRPLDVALAGHRRIPLAVEQPSGLAHGDVPETIQSRPVWYSGCAHRCTGWNSTCSRNSPIRSASRSSASRQRKNLRRSLRQSPNQT